MSGPGGRSKPRTSGIVRVCGSKRHPSFGGTTSVPGCFPQPADYEQHPTGRPVGCCHVRRARSVPTGLVDVLAAADLVTQEPGDREHGPDDEGDDAQDPDDVDRGDEADDEQDDSEHDQGFAP